MGGRRWRIGCDIKLYNVNREGRLPGMAQHELMRAAARRKVKLLWSLHSWMLAGVTELSNVSEKEVVVQLDCLVARGDWDLANGPDEGWPGEVWTSRNLT